MARKEKQEVIILALSMFLAFLLWAYVMGENSQETTRTIQNVPVKLINEESAKQQYDLVLVPDQKVTVNISIQGRGLSAFNVTPEDIVVEADLSGYPLKKGKNPLPYKVIKLPQGIRVEDNPAYQLISIELDAFVEKSVPVELSVTGNVKEGYGFLTPESRPSEVLVSGPERYVNSVATVAGILDIANTTTKDINSYIHLKPQGRDGKDVPYVEVDPKYVNAIVSVKPSKTVPVVIKTTGKVPGDKVFRGAKPKVENVTIIGDANVIGDISEIQTLAVDLSKITSTATREIFLNVPAGVTVANDLKSINVDFTVENKIQKDFSVNITLTNTQDVLKYELAQNAVSITVSGAESVVNSLDVKNFTAVIDLKDLAEGSHTMEISVTVPDNVDKVKQSLEKVSVVVSKK